MNDPRPRGAPRASDADVAASVARTIRDEIRSTAAYPVPASSGMIELHANESPWPLPDEVRAKLDPDLGPAPDVHPTGPAVPWGSVPDSVYRA